MELDWYMDKLGANAVLTPTHSSRWMSNFGDPDRPGSPRWFPFLSLIQDRKVARGYYSGDELSPSGSAASSPKKPTSPQCRRSLSGGDSKCPTGPSSLSPSSAKAHICFGCVLHSHLE